MTSRGQLVAFEVKQKYPTQANTFGINEGQKKLFEFLIGYGIPVLHIVLEKPVRNKEVHAIDILTLPQFTERMEWKYTRFFPEKLRHASYQAPQHTSIFGGSGLSYNHISYSQFASLKYFGVKTDDIRKKLFEGME